MRIERELPEGIGYVEVPADVVGTALTVLVDEGKMSDVLAPDGHSLNYIMCDYVWNQLMRYCYRITVGQLSPADEERFSAALAGEL